VYVSEDSIEPVDPDPAVAAPERPAPRLKLLRLIGPVQLIATAVLALWVLVLGQPIGIEGQWQWMVFDHGIPPLPLLAVVTAILMTALLAYALAERARDLSAAGGSAPWHEVGWRAVLILGGLTWTVGLYSLIPDGWRMLTGATLADVSNEYFAEAYGIHDPGRYCREYDSHQRDSAHHIATHPPGAVLTYYGLIRLYRATGLSVSAQGLVEWLHGQRAGAIMDQAARLPTVRRIPSDQVALPTLVALTFALLGMLSVLPAAACGRMLWGPRGAYAAGVLAATAPGLSLFFQSLDAVLALAAMTCIWAAARSILARRAWLGAIGTGFLLGASAFISFGMLAAAAICAIILIGGGCARHAEGLPAVKRGWLIHPAAMVAGIVLFWAPVCHLLGLDPMAMAARGGEAHHGVMQTFERAYSTWVWMNLVEYVVFLGPALLILALVALPAARRKGGLAPLYAAAVLGVLLLVDLSGTVRAEVGRIWVFFMPPMAVLAAGACIAARRAPEAEEKEREGLLGWTVLAQVVALVALAITVHPSVRPF